VVALGAVAPVALAQTPGDSPLPPPTVAKDANAAVRAEQDPATKANADVTVPPNGDTPVTLDATSRDQLGIQLPAGGPRAQVGQTAVYDGDAGGTQLAVQPFDSGVRTLIHIESPSSPTGYRFTLTGDATRLLRVKTGGIAALNAGRETIAVIPKPWAKDAAGADVPTRFAIKGLTITQVVDHTRGGPFKYPITADPSWWKLTKCVGAVALVAVPGTRALAFVRALGGVTATARLLIAAGSFSEFAAGVTGGAAALAGFTTIRNNCF
jgi:hypothetical protein